MKRDEFQFGSAMILGERLLLAGIVTAAQLDITLAQQKHLLGLGRSVGLGDMLVRNRFCTPDHIDSAMTQPGREIQERRSDVPLLSPADCSRLSVIPVQIEGDTLVVKTARALSPLDRKRILAACTVNARTLRAILVDRHEMHRFLSQQMDHDSFASMMDRLRSSEQNPSLLKAAINALLHEAIDRRASDIHIDVKPDPDSWISLRIDSILKQLYLLNDRTMASIMSRLKTLSGMDASDNRRAQDGRMSIDHRGRMVSFRVATQPLVDGETMTVRVIDAASLPTAEALFPNQPVMMRLLNQLANSEGKAGGLVLVTGSTGSGKSTTLHMLASRFPRDRKNIVTVEDPVEFVLPFTRQIQIHQLLNQKATEIERSVLRQDPDVLIFGEIRDADSARAAFKFAESGHLVLATLHAKSAAQSVERLLSMLPEGDRSEAAFVLATTLQAVVNQVLHAKLCDCSVGSDLMPMDVVAEDEDHAQTHLGYAVIEDIGSPLKHAKGCLRCDNTGYRDRVAIHETIIFDIKDEDRLVAANAVVKSGSISELLGAKGVTWIRRRDVASALLDSGLIDVPTALAAVDAKVARRIVQAVAL